MPTPLQIPTPGALAAACAADGELQLAVRHWNGGLRLEMGPAVTGLTVAEGQITAGVPDQGPGVVTISGDEGTWEPLTRTVPPRFANDISVAIRPGRLERSGDELAWWQYLPAVQRIVELLRAPGSPAPAAVREGDGTLPRFDSPVGGYVHLELGGFDHRIYFERAGSGIPVLLQHTAGSHGTQWRHLFENPRITEHFELIAYDLPFHGKSVPPVDRRWWEEQYRLTGDFLRSVPLTLARALGLERPVFMGCSVGGLLALDLALEHPEDFRAVIAVEGALHIGGEWEGLVGFWHPQVSNDTKARMMEGLTAPTSPDPYRKETVQAYASGWPQAFLGDLWYYLVDYDLRERAGEIDTERVGVHIMSGEYDYSGTIERGRAAHGAIAGSTFTEMAGIGHFPMSENPALFMTFLEPILDRIRRD